MQKILHRFKCPKGEFEAVVSIIGNSLESTDSEMETSVEGQSTQEDPTVQGKEQGQVKDDPKVPLQV